MPRITDGLFAAKAALMLANNFSILKDYNSVCIGNQKGHAAIAQPKMGDLHINQNTVKRYALRTPIKLLTLPRAQSLGE